MIIDCISDLHGYYPTLEGGDLLIVAGDFTAEDAEREHVMFCHWLNKQNYGKKIIVAGNHDNRWTHLGAHKGPDPINPNYEWYEYLCDSGTEFEGLNIWGSPWTLTFKGMNPECKAFTVDTEEELDKKLSIVPLDTNILITHQAPYGAQDFIINPHSGKKRRTGSLAVADCFHRLKSIRLHVFGHVHEGHGITEYCRDATATCDWNNKFLVNASHVNERYEPVNLPIRIDTNSTFDYEAMLEYNTNREKYLAEYE